MDPQVAAALINTVGAVLAALIPVIFSGRGKAKGEKPEAEAAAVQTAIASIPHGRWVGLHALATAVASVAGVGLGAVVPHFGNWALFGALVGFAQWLMLQRIGLSARWWVLASIIGWVVFPLAQTPVTWAACGAIAATLQWLSAPNETTKPMRWISVNAVGWLVAGNLGWAIGMLLLEPAGFGIAWVVGWTVVGATGGAFTGFVANQVFRPGQR
jgi:hypothetical protein